MKNRTSLMRTDLLIRMFGFRQIPLIYYTGLRVVCADDNICEVCIPLSWRTRNHLGSMYFGALAIGADVAGGLAAFLHVLRSDKNIAVVFKDMQAEFLKRPEGDVHFTCKQVAQVESLMKEVENSKDRKDITVEVTATVPTISSDAVARFKLTLSAKQK